MVSAPHKNIFFSIIRINQTFLGKTLNSISTEPTHVKDNERITPLLRIARNAPNTILLGNSRHKYQSFPLHLALNAQSRNSYDGVYFFKRYDDHSPKEFTVIKKKNSSLINPNTLGGPSAAVLLLTFHPPKAAFHGGSKDIFDFAKWSVWPSDGDK